MKPLQNQVAIVTGASSGFGESIARLLAEAGASVAIGARRIDRLQKLEEELEFKFKTKVFSETLDVQQTSSVQQFVDATLKTFGQIDILVNNAGKALGKRDIPTADEADWQEMMETNYMGVFRMTKAVLPSMQAKKRGHIVNIGSVAGHYPYEGGGGYCASKFALRAMTNILRLEMVEKQIKVTSIDPGMAETEFGIVRFKGDGAAAKKVYEGMTPLSAQDIAEAVLFAVTRPAHVNIDEIILTPLDQGSVFKVYRHT